VKSARGDSFFNAMCFSDVARGMEHVRSLVVGSGYAVQTAFERVFKGAKYKRTTFERHRDAYFMAKEDIVSEWKQNEGDRRWKEFYAQCRPGQFLGTVNRWFPSKEESKALQDARMEVKKKTRAEHDTKVCQWSLVDRN
jgi:hypothetical protein